MKDFIIIEGIRAATGEKVYVLHQDESSDCMIRLSFATLEDAKARAEHLRNVADMHRRMYGNDWQKRHNQINY